MRVAKDVIEPIEDYVNLLANSRKEFDSSVKQLRTITDRFCGVAEQMKIKAAASEAKSKTAGITGIAVGTGVAALAPSVAMAVATTFGTASTGTAIGALSGAAATNAALAWLGGGAIAAGGGGMVAGQALLALAGPIAWAIAGGTLLGSGIHARRNNKKRADQADQERLKVEGEVRRLRSCNSEIKRLISSTKTHSKGCLAELAWLFSRNLHDYSLFDIEAKERLAALINHVRALSALLHKEVALG